MTESNGANGVAPTRDLQLMGHMDNLGIPSSTSLAEATAKHALVWKALKGPISTALGHREVTDDRGHSWWLQTPSPLKGHALMLRIARSQPLSQIFSSLS